MKMRTFFLTVAAVVSACIMSCSCSAKNGVVKVQDLPQTAQTFLTEHFGAIEVALAILDDNEYEVRLENGWEIEFDRKGRWEKVDCKMDAVPESVIALLPESIPAYINGNFEKAHVTEITKDRSDYDIELSNGLDLEFSSKGQFRRIDD